MVIKMGNSNRKEAVSLKLTYSHTMHNSWIGACHLSKLLPNNVFYLLFESFLCSDIIVVVGIYGLL